ncbi:cytochrome P450 [Novosphingobium malaysiense]|uniref:Cytochrome P450 n=2 Tax=Novosphingobium malaysiense TaxID=1348853 RepID=A0A0B1ZMP0_9SPHN|nr:cytochrome P450 [Novosphingobium malaysiense]
MDNGRDDRKSGALAAANIKPRNGARTIGRYTAGRDILRSTKVRQAGAIDADERSTADPDKTSFFFLDGEEHRKRRGSVAGLFAPKAIVTRHQAVMERTMEAILADLQRTGRGVLDEMSWRMAVDVAAEIIGLTESDSNVDLAHRVRAVLDNSFDRKTGLLNSLIFNAKMAVRVSKLWKQDILPAVKARRTKPKDDVITYMVQHRYSKNRMIMECLAYGGAGMMTTREFICMCAWHLFEKPDLLRKFLEDGEAMQFAILEEILRLEPVVSILHRRVAEPCQDTDGAEYEAGDLVAINIREGNRDEAVTGVCPHAIDADRAKRNKAMGSYLSFGDGPHRCPGAQVALHETRIFLDRLFRKPGIRMEREPQMTWNSYLQGYELRGAIVVCERRNQHHSA